ncbi:unnamed protein product [Thlaspi arvense]|uniref:MATH domain-containing protein n=1 Tax=Thlaspi arvense TaxID=13288 RepID=A0AAU9SEZ5_THLAR|nr:unnamed protein product [Thlaspi arvense]
MGGRKWFIELYPKGDSRADGKWLSVYLCLADSDKPKADEKIFMQGHVGVLDPVGSKHFSRTGKRWHAESSRGWGWVQFLCLTELRKLYLDKEDTLKLEIEFEVVSATKYSPII